MQTLRERRNLHVYLEQKAELAVQGECAAQRRLSEAESRHGHEKWRTKKFGYCLYENQSRTRISKNGAVSGESMGRSDSKRKDYFCGELDMRNRLFQEFRARNCHDIQELRRICCEEQIEPDHWELMSCQCNKGGILLLSVSSWLKFRIYKIRWIPWPMQENFTILRQGAALEHPTFPGNPWLFRVPSGKLSLDSGLPLDTRNNMGTSGFVFWKPTCSRRTILSSLREFTEFGIIFLRTGTR